MENTSFFKIFSCIIENEKPHGALFKGPEGFLAVTVEVIWSVLWDLKNSIEQTFQKLALFTMTKYFGKFFVVLSSVTSLKKHNIGVHKLFWQLQWNLWEHIFRTWEVVENTSFWKKATFPAEKILWPIFGCNIEHDNCHGTVF